MTGSDSPAEGAGAAPAGHVPVMLAEVLAALAPNDGETFIDATFGAGGYSRAILEAAATRVLAIEQDPVALQAGSELVEASAGRLVLAAGRFSGMVDLAAAAGIARADGIVLDIGVSSMQLDVPARGFSFQADGPLDMRMDPGSGRPAADLVMTAEEAELADILLRLGEERQARRIARAIVAAREQAPIATTRQLAAIVERATGRRRDEDRHPATRTFQALRIAVNDELGELAAGLAAAEALLAPGGRLVVVTFHSLEDRIAKRFLARRAGRMAGGSRHAPPSRPAGREASFRIVNQSPLTPSQGEIRANPRARSAKLRAAVRTAAAPWPRELPAELGIPTTTGRWRP